MPGEAEEGNPTEVVEEPERERQDAAERSAEEEPVPSFGLLAAILFVRMTLALTFFMSMGMVLATLAILTGAPISDRPVHESMIASVVMVSASVLLVAMNAGGSLLDANLSGTVFSWMGQKGAHPVRQILLPLVGGIVAYSAVAIIVWPLWLLGGNHEVIGNWPWVMAWGTIGVVALFLCQHLNRVLPP